MKALPEYKGQERAFSQDDRYDWYDRYDGSKEPAFEPSLFFGFKKNEEDDERQRVPWTCRT
jgi:hypothetical protein